MEVLQTLGKLVVMLGFVLLLIRVWMLVASNIGEMIGFDRLFYWLGKMLRKLFGKSE